MNDELPQSAAPRSGAPAESPLLTLLSAALFLYVGFLLGLKGVHESAVYNGSVTALVWMARVVGIGLVLVAALAWARIRYAAAVDLGFSLIAAAGCLIIGAIWLSFGDMNGVLVLLFGLLNAVAARAAWRAIRTA